MPKTNRKPERPPVRVQPVVRRLLRAKLFRILFGECCWYRKFHGGHWELWEMWSPYCEPRWTPTESCVAEKFKHIIATNQEMNLWACRPECLACEDWPKSPDAEVSGAQTKKD